MEIVIEWRTWPYGGDLLTLPVRSWERRGWTLSGLFNLQVAGAIASLMDNETEVNLQTPNGDYVVDLSKVRVSDGPPLHYWLHFDIMREL